MFRVYTLNGLCVYSFARSFFFVCANLNQSKSKPFVFDGNDGKDGNVTGNVSYPIYTLLSLCAESEYRTLIDSRATGCVGINFL